MESNKNLNELESLLNAIDHEAKHILVDLANFDDQYRAIRTLSSLSLILQLKDKASIVLEKEVIAQRSIVKEV